MKDRAADFYPSFTIPYIRPKTIIPPTERIPYIRAALYDRFPLLPPQYPVGVVYKTASVST